LDLKIQQLIAKQEPAVARAFANAIADIRNRADIRKLRAALRNGGIEDAINALDIEPSAFNQVRAALLETYGNSGTLTIKGQTWVYPNGQRAVVRWNSLSPRAEEYARNVGTGLIQNTTDDMARAVREVIADGYAFGRKWDRIANDIVGRADATGKRSGGILGLNNAQAQWVQNMRQYLETDPKRAFGMTRRDKRFDATIKKAIDENKSLSAEQINRMVQRYSDRLLQTRGLIIAKTEVQKAIEEGKYEAWKQGLEKTGVPERFIIRKWRHTGRAMNDRPDHIMMNNREMRGLNFPFVLPDGTPMLHPHDTSLGAGASHVIGCMCQAEYRIDKKGLREWRG